MSQAHAEFLALLEPVYDRLSRYALAITRDEMDAEDLVSSTVLTALEQFDRLNEHDRFLQYLIKIASRLHKRRRYRERRQTKLDPSHAALLETSGPHPDESAELRIVMDALSRLPEKIRETVVLFDVADLSLEEIRSVQGGTLSGVKSRLRRGRQLLTRMLGVSVRERMIRRKIKRRQTPMLRMEDTSILVLAEEGYGK